MRDDASATGIAGRVNVVKTRAPADEEARRVAAIRRLVRDLDSVESILESMEHPPPAIPNAWWEWIANRVPPRAIRRPNMHIALGFIARDWRLQWQSRTDHPSPTSTTDGDLRANLVPRCAAIRRELASLSEVWEPRRVSMALPIADFADRDGRAEVLAQRDIEQLAAERKRLRDGEGFWPALTAEDPDPDHEREARAGRVAAMLDRWAQEDVSGEPDWDVGRIEPLRLPTPAATASGTRRTRRAKR